MGLKRFQATIAALRDAAARLALRDQEVARVAVLDVDDVTGGTLNGSGSLVMQADRVGGDTLLSQIVHMVAAAQRSRAPIQKLADRISAGFVLAVLGIVVLLTVIPGAPLRRPEGQVGGNLPLIDSLLFIITLFFLVAGVAFGRVVGTVKSSNDVIKYATKSFAGMGGMVLMFLMISQFIAFFNYSNRAASANRFSASPNVSAASRELTQHYPQPGWVEHDAEEIWAATLKVCREAIEKAGGAANIAASFSGGYPVTGGFARSVVNFDAGAKTQAAGAFTAIGIGLAAMFLTPLLHNLPRATLAGVSKSFDNGAIVP